MPGDPVVCAAADQCHAAGVCDPQTGTCSNPRQPNGTRCDDGDACTQTDTCQDGVCVGGDRVVCTASDQCHIAGECDPATGRCSDPAVADGTSCDDGNACTQGDTCQNGVCVSGGAVICAAPDQCQEAGECDPATGVCTYQLKPNGTPCDDGNACTINDTCQAGACLPGTAVVCAASDQCHVAGTCDPRTGTCSNPAADDGTPCDDDDHCTRTDTCQSGVCVGGDPVACTASDQCHVAGVCDPQTGVCSNPPVTDGTLCDDGDLCTQTDTCRGGVCVGSNPIVCAPASQCHLAGTCDPQRGICSNPLAPNGTLCDDGNLCTVNDVCQAGICAPGVAVVCTASDQCHEAGTCDPQTGACSNLTKADGASCDDGDACTQTDTCQGGICVGGNPLTCGLQQTCSTGQCRCPCPDLACFLTKWGTTGSGDGQMRDPGALTVAPSGNVYVTDSQNNRVQYFSPSGTYIGKWGSTGTGNGQFQVPSAVAVAPATPWGVLSQKVS